MTWFANEKAFLSKVTALGYTTIDCWNLQEWKGLDDILRLLRLLGPVECGLCVKQCSLEWQNKSLTSHGEDAIMKIVRNEIARNVSQGLCFEAKYNAANAIADIAMDVLARSLIHGAVWRVVTTALTDVIRLMTDAESEFLCLRNLEFSSYTNSGLAAQISKEHSSMPGLMDPEFLNQYWDQPWESFLLFSSLLKMNVVPYATIASSVEFMTLSDSECAKLHKLDEYQVKHSGNKPKALLLKLLYLHWSRRGHCYEGWTSDNLEAVIEPLLNNALPLSFKRFQRSVENVLPLNSKAQCTPSQKTEIIDTINRGFRHISERARASSCLETKILAFRTYLKIDLRLALCMKAQDATGALYKYSFKQIHDSLMTSSMLMTCQSSSNAELRLVFSDKQVLNDLTQLSKERLTGMFDGFDLVFRAIVPVLSTLLRERTDGGGAMLTKEQMSEAAWLLTLPTPYRVESLGSSNGFPFTNTSTAGRSTAAHRAHGMDRVAAHVAPTTQYFAPPPVAYTSTAASRAVVAPRAHSTSRVPALVVPVVPVARFSTIGRNGRTTSWPASAGSRVLTSTPRQGRYKPTHDHTLATQTMHSFTSPHIEPPAHTNPYTDRHVKLARQLATESRNVESTPPHSTTALPLKAAARKMSYDDIEVIDLSDM